MSTIAASRLFIDSGPTTVRLVLGDEFRRTDDVWGMFYDLHAMLKFCEYLRDYELRLDLPRNVEFSRSMSSVEVFESPRSEFYGRAQASIGMTEAAVWEVERVSYASPWDIVLMAVGSTTAVTVAANRLIAVYRNFIAAREDKRNADMAELARDVLRSELRRVDPNGRGEEARRRLVEDFIARAAFGISKVQSVTVYEDGEQTDAVSVGK